MQQKRPKLEEGGTEAAVRGEQQVALIEDNPVQSMARTKPVQEAPERGRGGGLGSGDHQLRLVWRLARIPLSSVDAVRGASRHHLLPEGHQRHNQHSGTPLIVRGRELEEEALPAAGRQHGPRLTGSVRTNTRSKPLARLGWLILLSVVTPGSVHAGTVTSVSLAPLDGRK